MTALTPEQKERRRAARERADRISRNGLFREPPDLRSAVERARVSQDWRTLGYDSWETYVEREFVDHMPDRADWIRSFLAPAEQRRRGTDKRDVYFIQPAHGGLIKIGVAANPGDRCRTLQLTSPCPLVVLATIRGVGQAHETQLHKKFAEHRHHGEWFEPAPELLAYVAEHATPATRSVRTS